MDRFKMDYFIAMIPKVIKLLPATVKAGVAVAVAFSVIRSCVGGCKAI